MSEFTSRRDRRLIATPARNNDPDVPFDDDVERIARAAFGDDVAAGRIASGTDQLRKSPAILVREAHEQRDGVDQLVLLVVFILWHGGQSTWLIRLCETCNTLPKRV